MGVHVEEILELGVNEKLHIIGEIWDSIARQPETVQISDEERRELDIRLLEYRATPNEGIEWTDFKKKLS